MATFTPLIAVSLKIGEGSPVIIREGDLLTGVRYTTASGDKTVSGSVRVLDVTSTLYNAGPKSCPANPFFRDIASVPSMVLDTSATHDASLVTINLKDILEITEVETPSDQDIVIYDPSGDSGLSLGEVINLSGDGSTIRVLSGDIDDVVNIDKSVHMKGVNAGIPQNQVQEVM